MLIVNCSFADADAVCCEFYKCIYKSYLWYKVAVYAGAILIRYSSYVDTCGGKFNSCMSRRAPHSMIETQNLTLIDG